MNVGSIYQASHILGTLPSQRTQEAAGARNGLEEEASRQSAAVGAMGTLSKDPAGSVNMAGQRLGQLLNASA